VQGNCIDISCLINNTANCINGTPNYLFNGLDNTKDFTANMQFFNQWKDSNSNPIFNSSDIIGFMSMHSVGGVNNWVNNDLLTTASP